MIRQYRAAGLSLREIAGRLNQCLIPTKKSGIWQANTVRNILARALWSGSGPTPPLRGIALRCLQGFRRRGWLFRNTQSPAPESAQRRRTRASRLGFVLLPYTEPESDRRTLLCHSLRSWFRLPFSFSPPQEPHTPGVPARGVGLKRAAGQQDVARRKREPGVLVWRRGVAVWGRLRGVVPKGSENRESKHSANGMCARMAYFLWTGESLRSFTSSTIG